MQAASSPPFAALSPDRILAAIEACGLVPDGRMLPLNSYENRVYRIGIEGQGPLVAKFYRPARWSDDQILEEHGFIAELADHEIPAVPPLMIQGSTLQRFEGFRLSLTPMHGGRTPALDDDAVLEQLGRYLARIHAIGAIRPFDARPALDIAAFGERPSARLLSDGWIPQDLESSYGRTVAEALDATRAAFAAAGEVAAIRLHGDCHPGNLLWTATGPHFVDFDDARSGPAIQDIWMLLSGERQEMVVQLGAVLSGYEAFHDFDYRQLHLVEALRTLRMIHFSAWLAQRWDDPAFPPAFPWFNTRHYWQEQILQLQQQVLAIEAGPLWRPW